MPSSSKLPVMATWRAFVSCTSAITPWRWALRSRLADSHLAEDAAQEAFAVACRRLAGLRNGEKFGQWLGTICRRVAGKISRMRVKHVPLENENLVASNAGENESHQHVRSAVDRLRRSPREVILLHYFSGLSYDEIGRALGISTQSVHGRLQRARRQLASQLSTETSEAISHE